MPRLDTLYAPPVPDAALDIVIVSYGSRELVRACLASLAEHASARPATIRVVDNDPAEGAAALILAEFPAVRVIEPGRNLGFAAASNLAISDGHAPYVLALNPDTRVTAGALDTLIDLMEARPETAVCGCRLVLEDGRLDHAASRSFPTILGALGHFTGLASRAGSRRAGRLGQYREPLDRAATVDAVNGAFMLMRRDALAEVGAFDEGFWMYMEDLDLCYRLRAAGWLVWYEPSVTVIHVKHGTTAGRRSARLNRAFHYGMFRFYRKHYAAARSPLANAVVYAAIVGKACLAIAREALRRR